MKREDIAQAFHLIAMGRANHPLQVELIDALAALIDKPEVVTAEDIARATVPVQIVPVDHFKFDIASKRKGK